MKAKPASGSGAAAGSPPGLRQQAEKIARARKGGGLEDRAARSPAAVQRLIHDLQVHQIELELQNEELRHAQDALEVSRNRYFDLYNLAPAGYFTLDEAGFILEANLTGATLLGVTRGALVGKPFSRFVSAEDADAYHLQLKQFFRTGAPAAFELRLSRPGGASWTAWVEGAIVVDAEGNRVCRKVVSDISERKTTQEKLRQDQNLLQTAGLIAQVGGWAVRLPGNELAWSDEICTILDFPKGTVPVLADALTLYPPASRTIISNALNICARDGIPFDCELEIFTARRRRLDVRAIGQAVRDAGGNIIGIEGAFQDISARKKAEQTHLSLEAQLRESQKMEAIGTLAGGIAHDFNNILGAILGNVELARQDAAANWQALVSLDEIQKAGHRARDLVQQILSFSRRQPTSRRMMALAPVVEESVRLLRAALHGSLQINCHCAADTPSVVVDPTQVQQVLLNLGTNAAHAMQGRRGCIDIQVEGVALDALSAQHDPKLRPGRYARIVVSDAGHGMDSVTRRRIFEPFFTTKRVGEGTGLGLSVVHGIMQTHEGAVIAHSEPGKGSRFELYFPRAADETAARSALADVAAAGAGRGQHVLYIDDDEAQVYLNRRMLERWGYRVSAYIEQGEALGALNAGTIQFDLVVTDFNMPGMSGLEVARAICKVRPDLPVIVVSGYITDTLRPQAAAAGVRELIAKTQMVEELRDAMQRVMLKPSHS